MSNKVPVSFPHVLISCLDFNIKYHDSPEKNTGISRTLTHTNEGHGRVGCVLQKLDENIAHSDPQNGKKEKQ